MFCRKCGAQLRDDDAFCSKCGAKVLRDVSPDSEQEETAEATGETEQRVTKSETVNVMPSEEDKSQVRYGFGKSVLRFVICMVALAVCDTVIYAMFPSDVSVTEFIASPHGLTRMMGQGFGSALVAIVFILPLLYGLRKVGYARRTYSMEVFFALSLVSSVFGSSLRTVWPPVLILALVSGIALQVGGRWKAAHKKD